MGVGSFVVVLAPRGQAMLTAVPKRSSCPVRVARGSRPPQERNPLSTVQERVLADSMSRKIVERQQGGQGSFEYKLGKYVFDLALLDTKTLVEFDGPYHRDPKQKQMDADKEKAAGIRGFVVIRRLVKPAVVIDPETIGGL